MIKAGQETTTKKSVAIALLLIISFTQLYIPEASAASSELTGVVIDEATGEPIPDAKLTILYRRYSRYWYRRWSSFGSTTTDSQGRYSLRLDTESNYLILVSHIIEGEHEGEQRDGG